MHTHNTKISKFHKLHKLLTIKQKCLILANRRKNKNLSIIKIISLNHMYNHKNISTKHNSAIRIRVGDGI